MHLESLLFSKCIMIYLFESTILYITDNLKNRYYLNYPDNVETFRFRILCMNTNTLIVDNVLLAG